jgi:hypothetical protein
MQYEDLAKAYETKTNEELLRLALDSEHLTQEASAVLSSELSRRGISGTERLAAFRDEEEQRKEELARNPGSLFLLHPYGIGRKRLGKAGRVYTPETRVERFRTTVFVVLFWLPLIPTGSYLVERKREFLSNEMTILKKLPLDWEQVLKVWVVAATILLALVLVIKRL